MRTVIILLLVGCVLATIGAVGEADAQLLGEFCWLKQPFFDILKLALTQNGSQIAATGVQFINGGYSVPFVGSLFVVGGQAILGGTLTGDLNPLHFNGSASLALSATLSTTTGGGPSTTVGIDGKFAATDSTLVVVPCPTGPTVHDAGVPGKAEGL